jgi:hypothetical protein
MTLGRHLTGIALSSAWLETFQLGKLSSEWSWRATKGSVLEEELDGTPRP